MIKYNEIGYNHPKYFTKTFTVENGPICTAFSMMTAVSKHMHHIFPPLLRDNECRRHVYVGTHYEGLA